MSANRQLVDGLAASGGIQVPIGSTFSKMPRLLLSSIDTEAEVAGGNSQSRTRWAVRRRFDNHVVVRRERALGFGNRMSGDLRGENQLPSHLSLGLVIRWHLAGRNALDCTVRCGSLEICRFDAQAQPSASNPN